MKNREKQTKATNESVQRRVSEYTTASEFCEIFSQRMNSLYSLSLWLTASHEKAEQCFLAALEDCRKATSVFRPWADSWSRLAVIENAIRLVKPTLAIGSGSVGDVPAGTHPSAGPVLKLNAFDRFIFVLSVLDRYSSRDCAILLRCSWQDVERAKRRAVEIIGNSGKQVLAPFAAMSTPLVARSAMQH